MRKIIYLIFVFAMFFTSIGYAHEQEDFDNVVRLIQSKIPCDQLSDEQLELMGDYFMEQMHPGELHEIMDERMGGEGSIQLKNVHINMARMFYCGESNVMPMSMMNMMINRGGENMMDYNYNTGFGMMYGLGWFGWILMILFWIAIVLLIIWIIQQFTKHKEDKESALDILERRFAKGEISKKEYLERKKTLKK